MKAQYERVYQASPTVTAAAPRTPAPWEDYILAPSSRTLRPEGVHASSGSVDDIPGIDKLVHAVLYGVLGFAGSILREVKGKGVKVTTLTPGIIDTFFGGGITTWATSSARRASPS